MKHILTLSLSLNIVIYFCKLTYEGNESFFCVKLISHTRTLSEYDIELISKTTGLTIEEIEKLDKQNFGETMFSEYESKYQYPLALAIIFLALELFIFERRNKIINTATIFGRKESNDKN